MKIWDILKDNFNFLTKKNVESLTFRSKTKSNVACYRTQNWRRDKMRSSFDGVSRAIEPKASRFQY